MGTKKNWKEIRACLGDKDAKDLLGMIKELHDLNPENRRFLGARFVSSESDLSERKKIIANALRENLERSGKVDFRSAKKEISDFKKTRDNNREVAELMVFYVETANQLTLDYGDMWEQFYTSVETMFQSAALHLASMRNEGERISLLKDRLESVVESTHNIGWGYHDTLSAIYDEILAELA